MNRVHALVRRQLFPSLRATLLAMLAILTVTAGGCGSGNNMDGNCPAECRSCSDASCMASCKLSGCMPGCDTATTCEARGKNCGTISDGCGGTLDCGTCSSWLTCGGGGTDNVCGATCAGGCPDGYTCDSRGVCSGGMPTGLTLDVKSVAVDGAITLNGALPTTTCTTSSPASVVFRETTKGYQFTMPVPCAPTFAFSGSVYPGTYRVYVAGNSNSNLPTGSSFLAQSELVIDKSKSGVMLDVKTATVDGNILLNGAAPTSTCMTASPATVYLEETTIGYRFSVTVPCAPTFAWTTTVYPGTYKVSVSGNTNSNLPTGTAQIVNSALTVQGAVTGQVLDVRTATAEGRITLNGITPTSTCATSSPATVTFLETNRGYLFSLPVPCSPAFTFAATLYPGTYRVSVSGNTNSNLPTGAAQVVNPSVNVSSNVTGLTLDVKTVTIDGKVLLNGSIPTTTCMTASPATVVLFETTRGYRFSLPVPCSPTFAWNATVYPGTYKVTVQGNTNSNLPTGSAFVALPALPIMNNQTGVTLDVKTVAVDGKILLNGMLPTSTCMTASPATVLFNELTDGYSLSTALPCDPAFPFTTTIYPGTYRVSVQGSTNSNLPTGSPFVAIDRIKLQ